MMSMADLDRIHCQLKDAIKAHQMLVAQMKTESECCDVQKTLHELQAEIKSLSQQQRLAVHQLRQDILTLQGSSSQQHETMNSVTNKFSLGIDELDAPLSAHLVVKEEILNSSDEALTVNESGSIENRSYQQVCSLPLANDDVQTKNHLKLSFMTRLHLITPNALKELKMKRTEQKRRAIGSNNLCYGQFEPEGHSELREDYCSVCRRSGDLLMCDVCSLVYHLQCLDPPLLSVPVGLWSCPKCQALSKLCGGKDDWPGTLALVHSYLTHKAAREDEKQRMKRVNEHLTTERKLLENKASQMVDLIAQRNERRAELIEARTKAQLLYENLRQFVLRFRAQ